jgi:hypothetical protein
VDIVLLKNTILQKEKGREKRKAVKKVTDEAEAQ